jgi:hypothetical protein
MMSKCHVHEILEQIESHSSMPHGIAKNGF